MELREFLHQGLEPDKYIRAGQKLIIRLHRIRPDLYHNVLWERVVDAYYDDTKLWELLEWLQKNW